MKVIFSAEIEVPDGTPIDDVEQWLLFHLGEIASLRLSNPMSRYDLESVMCRNIKVEKV